MENDLDHEAPPRRRVRPWLWVSLVAAVAAIWLSQREPTVEVTELLLAPYPAESDRDVHRGWIAQIRLERDGYPVLVHVDPDGWPVVLYPEGRLGRLSSEDALLLPDPARGVTWSWPEDVDPEDLMAVATTHANLDLRKLGELLRREATRSPSADEARSRVREVLEREVGPVRSARLVEPPARQVAGQT